MLMCVARQIVRSARAARRAPIAAAAASFFAATLHAATAAAQSYLIPPRFENAGHFHEGVAPVQEQGLWGLIDRQGNWVLPPRYDGVSAGAAGRFGVLKDGRWGVIAIDGAEVLPPRFEALRLHDERGLIAVVKDGLWGYITVTGGVETPFMFEALAGREGRFIVGRDAEGWMVWDTHGAERSLYGDSRRLALPRSLLPPTVGAPLFNAPISRLDGVRDDVFPGRWRGDAWLFGMTLTAFQGATGGLYAMRLDDDSGFDDSGFDRVRAPRNGVAGVRRDGLWGFVKINAGDQDGKSLSWLIRPRFDAARDFAEGLAPVQVDGLWGYVDTRGRLVVPPRYDAAYSFKEGYATVRLGDRRGFLKRTETGAEMFAAPQFDDVWAFREGAAPVKTGGLWGFLAAEGAPPAAPARPIVDLTPEG